jgi:hypothetical protein
MPRRAKLLTVKGKIMEPLAKPSSSGLTGAVTSGSIGGGIAILIKLEFTRRGVMIDDAEAYALIPLAIAIVHPIGQVIGALVDALTSWLRRGSAAVPSAPPT